MCLVHKVKTQQGFTAKTIFRKDFNLKDQAELALKTDYTQMFSFYRNGWEYTLNSCQIIVDNIETLKPTIEIVSSHYAHIQDISEKLLITQIIDHSVPYLIQQQKLNDI